MKKIKNWLINLICKEIQAGGWCGLCGIWIDYELLPTSWPYTLCKKCRNQPTTTILNGKLALTLSKNIGDKR